MKKVKRLNWYECILLVVVICSVLLVVGVTKVSAKTKKYVKINSFTDRYDLIKDELEETVQKEEAIVEYKNNGKIKSGYMDIRTGEITKNRKNYKCHFKNYNDQGKYELQFLNEKGKIKKALTNTSQHEYRCYHEFNKKLFLVFEVIESVDGNKVNMGFMNNNGEWVSGSEPLTLDDTEYLKSVGILSSYQLGKGIFAIDIGGSRQYDDSLYIFNANTKKIFVVDNVYAEDMKYINHKMIYKNGKYGLEIYSLDENGKITKLHDGGNVLCRNKNGYLTDENGISYYDLNGNLKWSYDQYKVTNSHFSGNYLIVNLEGKDGNTSYLGCIDAKTGKLLYEPLYSPMNGVLGSYDAIIGRYLLSIRNGKGKITDLTTGKETNRTIKLQKESSIKDFDNNQFIIVSRNKHDKYSYRIFTDKGKEIKPYIMKK